MRPEIRPKTILAGRQGRVLRRVARPRPVTLVTLDIVRFGLCWLRLFQALLWFLITPFAGKSTEMCAKYWYFQCPGYPDSARPHRQPTRSSVLSGHIKVYLARIVSERHSSILGHDIAV